MYLYLYLYSLYIYKFRPTLAETGADSDDISDERFFLQGYADDNSVHVKLGANDNMETTVGTGFTPTLKTVKTPHLLNCNVAIHFWALWTHATLRIGKGVIPGDGEILEFSNAAVLSINTVGFGSLKAGGRVRFYVESVQGKTLSLPGLEYSVIPPC